MGKSKAYFEPEEVPLNEVGFGLDDFQEPKVLSPIESIEQVFHNIFMVRPGTLPSQPHLGIDIRKYLYKFEDQIDTDGMRDEIFRNCIDLFSFIEYDDILITPMDFKGDTLLLIVIPLKVGPDQISMFMSFQSNDKDNVLYRFKAAVDETQVV